jgi:predicted glutamine amidotransferase
MCRLLAYVTKEPAATTDRLCQAMLDFRKLAKMGCVPCAWTPGHEDGWGVTAYKDGAPALYYRSVKPAVADTDYLKITAAIKSLKPETVLLHLRKTSAGSNITVNTQPFISDTTSLCQNGTIYMPKSTSSDTLRFFREIVADGKGADSYLRIHRQFARKYQMTAMNMFFCDGPQLIVAQHYNADYPQAAELDFAKYYTLQEMADKGATFICSEPLKALSSLKRTPLTNGTFNFYKNGRRAGAAQKI